MALIDSRGSPSTRGVRFAMSALAFSTVIALCAPSAHAQATTSARLHAFAQLGLFGDVRAVRGSQTIVDSLEPSMGGGVGIEIPVAEMFSVGVEATGWMWGSDGTTRFDIGSSLLLDLSFVPRLRFPWATGGGPHGAIAIGVPLGGSLDVLDDTVQDGLSVLGASADVGYGLHVGGMLNGQFFFTQRFGITTDAGYLHHVVWHQVEATAGEGEVRLDMGQLVVRVGIAVTL